MPMTEVEQALFKPVQRVLKNKTVYVLKDATHEDPRTFRLYRIQDQRPYYVTRSNNLKRFVTKIKIIAQITDEDIEKARIELAEMEVKKKANEQQFQNKALWWQKDD